MLIIYVIIFLILIAIFYWVGNKYQRADWSNPIVNCLDGWLRIYCKKFHKMEFKPLEIPNNEGALLASNHVSGLDPLILIASSDRPLRFIIAKEEYNRFGLTWLFKMVGAIPVDRGGRVDSAFRKAVKQIKKGEVIALFPHGKIHLDHEERVKVKLGIIKLADLCQCRIYPVRLTGIRGQGKVFTSLFLSADITIKNFPPLYISEHPHEEFAHKLGELLMGKRIILENEKSNPI